jgi:hypothetical protein
LFSIVFDDGGTVIVVASFVFDDGGTVIVVAMQAHAKYIYFMHVIHQVMLLSGWPKHLIIRSCMQVIYLYICWMQTRFATGSLALDIDISLAME